MSTASTAGGSTSACGATFKGWIACYCASTRPKIATSHRRRSSLRSMRPARPSTSTTSMLPAPMTTSKAATSRDRPPRPRRRRRKLPALTIGIIDTAVAIAHAVFADAEIVQQDFVPLPRRDRWRTGLPSRRYSSARTACSAQSPGPHDCLLRPCSSPLTPGIRRDDRESRRGARVARRRRDRRRQHEPRGTAESRARSRHRRGQRARHARRRCGRQQRPRRRAAVSGRVCPVVGVTAVDSANRIYRYANRGRHVTFAAPGVRVKVADDGGGYSTESGTSMAAPYAAAIIAQAVAKGAAPSNSEVLAALKATAIDLGAKDFDDVFGYGLIANAQLGSRASHQRALNFSDNTSSEKSTLGRFEPLLACSYTTCAVIRSTERHVERQLELPAVVATRRADRRRRRVVVAIFGADDVRNVSSRSPAMSRLTSCARSRSAP